MENNQQTRDYNWIIFFLLFGSALVRFVMHYIQFEYIDYLVNYFVSIIGLIGLDYTSTNILNRSKRKIEEIIDNSNDIVTQAKNNKKKKIEHFVHLCIGILIIYNILHIFLLSSSTGNDMLSMIFLGISLTDDSIINFFVKYSPI